MNYEKTGHLIAERRLERGLTQAQLAEKLGVSNRTISKWECGKGFPDVSLLEPLSSELELSLQALISGEAEAVQNEISVWSVVSFIYQQYRGKTRRFIRNVVGGTVFALLVGFFIFVVLDYNGAFLKDIETDVVATVFQDGVPIGETVVAIKGTQKTLGKGNDNFVGKFQVECLDRTTDKNLAARITWDSIGEGFHEIVFFMPGPFYVDTEIQRYLYISRDMKSFALELNDGRIIATNNALAELEEVTDWRYNISYKEFFFDNKN